MKSFKLILYSAMVVLFMFSGALSAAMPESAEVLLQKAYFLEHAKSDFAAAAQLYAKVSEAKEADSGEKALAGERLAICREEIAVSDLARLMPPALLAYVEMHSSVERYRLFLGQLGLLAGDDRPPIPGQNCLAVSPALIETLAGSAAFAVTGIDAVSGRLTGVVVIHSRHLGFIETLLPATAQVLQLVNGYPVYKSGDLFLAVTRRLYLLASTQQEIADVLRRLGDRANTSASLATDPEWSEMLKDRRGEALFFFAHPKLLLSLLKIPPAGEAPTGQLLPTMQALFGFDNPRALSGRLDFGAEGLTLNLVLHLEKGPATVPGDLPHPLAIDREMLRYIPAGTPLMFALGIPGPIAPGAASWISQPPAQATPNIMQTIFSAIRGVAIYIQPPVSGDGEQDIPDIVVVVTARDVAKLQALEEKVRGLAGPAIVPTSANGTLSTMSAAPMRLFRIGDRLTVYSTWVDDRLYLTAGEIALKRALDTAQAGQSVLDDPVYAANISRLSPDTMMALFANAGRCIAAARLFMAPGEAASLEPMAGILAHTSIAFTAERTGQLLKLSAAFSGIPDVSAPLNLMLTEKQRQQNQAQEVSRSIHGEQSAQTLVLMAQQLEKNPDGVESLQKIFDVLALEKQDRAAAATVAESFARAAWNDSQALNRFAWVLLTEEKYGKRFNDIALRLSRRSNELTNQQRWGFLDTLALAEFENGNVRPAIRIEQRAADILEARGGDDGLADVLKTLKRFRAALSKRTKSTPAKSH